MTARGDLNGWWRFAVAVVGTLARASLRIRVTGADRLPASGPAIVAGNHLSALDGILLALIVARDGARMTRFLVAAEFFRQRVFGWALRTFRQIPLRRGEADADALDVAIRTARRGAIVGIFPEGLVNGSPGDGLQRGRTGVARIALASGSPVIPVGIWGTHLRYPKSGLHFRRPWRPTVGLAFGAPVAPEGDPASVEDVQRFTEIVMQRIGASVDDARRVAGP